MPLIIVGGRKKFGHTLRSVARNAEDMRPMWERYGLYVSNQVMRQFATEGAHFGTPWRPLTPAYAARKRRDGFRGKILVRTGFMKRSFSWPLDVMDIKRDSAMYGSTVDTAIWHHHGTKRNGRQINPPRPILVLTPQMEKWAITLAKRHLLGEES